MKRIIAIALCLCLTLGLASCGDSSEKTTSTKASASAYQQKPLSDNFYAYQFQVDGDVITLPIKKNELESLGFEVSETGGSLVKYEATKDNIRFGIDVIDDYIFGMTLAGPDCDDLKGHEVKISGNFTMYKDNYQQILEKLGKPTGDRYGDEYEESGKEECYIRLYNDGGGDKLTSVFMRNKEGLPKDVASKVTTTTRSQRIL